MKPAQRPARPQVGTSHVGLRFPDDTLSRLDDWADRQGFTRSHAIVRLIETALREHETAA